MIKRSLTINNSSAEKSWLKRVKLSEFKSGHERESICLI